MSEQIISISELHYTYGRGENALKALNGITLGVDRGEIFGFLGPNGAGKTTTIKLILGIHRSQKGRISIEGLDPVDIRARKHIGYMPEIADYYGDLTPLELLNMYGDIFSLDRRNLRKRSLELLDMVGLADESKRLMRTFSKGMKQKVSFAQALINDPDLLVLDEPTSGLDPLARKQMRDVIKGLRDRGKTIFFSSHELSEVELISDRIAILNKGTLLETGPVRELLGGREQGQSLESYFLKIIER